MTRTAFLIDGFNLYHSLRDASRDLEGAGTRWLDLLGLCTSFLNEIGGNAQVSEIGYFSALAHHLEPIEPGLVARHLAYIDCLLATGVRVELGHFKPKRVLCPVCGLRIVRYEEKETDVAIGTRLLELAVSGECDAIVIVSGDSDLAPALRAARRCRARLRLLACFPYHRRSKELAALADRCFKLRKERYVAHQLADPVDLTDGRRIARPANW